MEGVGLIVAGFLFVYVGLHKIIEVLENIHDELRRTR